jgi:hypothetical protein
MDELRPDTSRCLPLPDGWPRQGKAGLCSLLSLLYLSSLLFNLFPRSALAEDYSFDPSEVEKKTYHLSGYMEAKPLLFGLDKNASLYKLKLYNRKEGDTLAEYDGTLQLEGNFDYGISRFYGRTNTSYKKSYLGEDQQTTLQEGYLSLKPTSSFKIDVGKKTLNWGKGYAWNPVAFLDRLKDPDDPELSREGYAVLSADFIKSFGAPLKTISFTPVLLPASGRLNDEFGTADHLNVAGKLYFLLYDTDIDLIYLSNGSKSSRYGFDFSRNITTNLEVHGEFAWINEYEKQFIDSSGSKFQTTSDAQNYLIGLRYLTEKETTYILEYYHNDTGFTSEEMADYFSFINTGYNTFLSSGNTALLNKALTLTAGNYGKMSPMQDYLYFRISQKEPFDILYFTPAITLLENINDKSYSITPELLYTGITNFEFRLRTACISGARNTEYSEKQNDYRIELMIRYYF